MSNNEQIKHTPGPWEMNQGYKGSGPWDRIEVYSIPHEYVVHSQLRQLDGKFRPHDKADAQLISAAPEMLEALENFIELAELNSHISAETRQEIITKAKTVVTKAKGTQS